MKTNNKLLNNFLNDKTIAEKSENTTSSYKKDLIHLLLYLKQKKINAVDNDITDLDEEFLKKITYDDLEEYNNMMYNKGNSPATRSRAISAIKQFFKYLQKKNVITDNPANGLVKPEIPKRERVYLSFEDAVKLLESVKGKNKERDYAILTLFLNCGFRRAELVSININKIKDEMITIIGKGNKERTVAINNSCIKAIEEYLKVRPNIEGENALFLSEKKQRISERTVYHLVKKYLNMSVEESDKYSVHTLRHTAASLMYNDGDVDIRALQDILGHENIHTTEIYTHVNKKTMKKAINSNPLNNYKQAL